MAALVPFYSFIEAAMEKVHDMGADTFKLLLSNSAPSQSNTQKSDISEISGGSGYTTGGNAPTITSSAQSSGAYKWIVADLTITATGTIPTWRYAIIYNDTSTGDKLVCYYDNGSAVNMVSADTFLFDFNGTSGIFGGGLS